MINWLLWRFSPKRTQHRFSITTSCSEVLSETWLRWRHWCLSELISYSWWLQKKQQQTVVIWLFLNQCFCPTRSFLIASMKSVLFSFAISNFDFKKQFRLNDELKHYSKILFKFLFCVSFTFSRQHTRFVLALIVFTDCGNYFRKQKHSQCGPVGKWALMNQ